MIGARDKAGADNVAVHTIIIIILLSIAFTVPFYLFAPQLFALAGAGKATGLAVAYARAIFLGSIIIFFSNVANAILRSEGDSKRAMYMDRILLRLVQQVRLMEHFQYPQEAPEQFLLILKEIK